MKLISGLVTIAIAADGTKKVPPRHPLQRLKTIKTFFVQYVDEIMTPMKIANSSLKINPEKFKARMINMTVRMENAFNRPTCGYFDSSTQHGGPDPMPNHRENGKPRNRRNTDDDDDEEVNGEDQENNLVVVAACAVAPAWTVHDLRADCCDASAVYYAANTSGCDETAAAAATAAAAGGKFRAKGGKAKKSQWDRLAQDPTLKFKQILTGTRKWAERYIGNCGGQRKQNLIKNRTKSMLNRMLAKLELTQY